MSATPSVPSDPLDPTMLEHVFATGRLESLTHEQRMSYYRMRCEAAGLDMRSQPFQFLNLQGKLVLYATRACTQQLAAKHSVSTDVLSQSTEGDLRIVMVRAVAGNRHTDEIGVVSVAGLRGEVLANALMKAVTKAKRRAVLALCGLGEMDETEVESSSASEEDVAATRTTVVPQANAMLSAPIRSAGLSLAVSEPRPALDPRIVKQLMSGREAAGWTLEYLAERAKAIAAPATVGKLSDLTEVQALKLIGELDSAAYARQSPRSEPAAPPTQPTPPSPALPGPASANLIEAVKAAARESGISTLGALRTALAEITTRPNATESNLSEAEATHAVKALRARVRGSPPAAAAPAASAPHAPEGNVKSFLDAAKAARLAAGISDLGVWRANLNTWAGIPIANETGFDLSAITEEVLERLEQGLNNFIEEHEGAAI